MKKTVRIIGVVLIVGFLAFLVFMIWPEKAYKPYQVSPAYQAKVDAITMPAFPDDWQWQTYTAKDGAHIRWGHTGFNVDAKATIILMPGYTTALDSFAEHLSHWADQGYNVVGIDIRGQGGSDRPLANPEKYWIDSFATYADDISGLLADEVSPKTDTPLIIVASSFGAHVAYRTVGDYETAIDGMVLNAPAFSPKVPPFSTGVAKKVFATMKFLGKSKRYAPGQHGWRPLSDDMTKTDDCSDYLPRYNLHDVAVVKNPKLRMGAATNQWISEMIKSGEVVTAPDYSDKITIPIQMNLIENDGIIVNQVAEQACADNPNCSFTYIPDTKHCILYGDDIAVGRVYDAVDAMVAKLAR